MRMFERGDCLSFAQKAVGKPARAELDRHIAMQSGVPRLPHFSHAAFADGGDEFIRASLIAGLSFHQTEPNRFNPLYRFWNSLGSRRGSCRGR